MSNAREPNVFYNGIKHFALVPNGICFPQYWLKIKNINIKVWINPCKKITNKKSLPKQ